MKFGRIVLQVTTHRLTAGYLVDLWNFQGDGRDVISRRKKCCRLWSGECTRSVCPAHMQQRPPVPDP